MRVAGQQRRAACPGGGEDDGVCRGQLLGPAGLGCRKRDLGEPRRMPRLEDEAARANTYISNDADWLDFRTTVCTASHTLYRKAAFCSPMPFMAPSTMLSRYISGMAGARVSR